MKIENCVRLAVLQFDHCSGKVFTAAVNSERTSCRLAHTFMHQFNILASVTVNGTLALLFLSI